MKVLLLAEACAAGVGRHVIDLARGLSASHEVHTLYSPARTDRRFLESIAELRGCAVPMRHGPHPGDLATGATLRRYVHRHGPFNVIHAHSTKAGLLARTVFAGLPGERIYTPHAPLTLNPALNPLLRAAIQSCENILALWTSRIIAVSPEERAHLKKLRIPGRKLAMVPNGIVAAPPLPSKPAGPPLRIGFLGRLAPQKNVCLLLEAFARVRKNHPDPAQLELAIAGDGPLEPALRLQAQALGITSAVRWLGQCDSAVLATFDIFALPSLYEALPYVLLEAMSHGLPVVSTQVGGVSLLLKNHANGFATPVGDVSCFSSALQTLIASQTLRTRMGAASRELAATFTVQRMVAGVTAVYERCLEERFARFAKPLQEES